MSVREQVLILGGATHRNRGDIAMQAGLAQWVRRLRPESEILFLSSSPDAACETMPVPCARSPDELLSTTWTRETPKSTRQRRQAIRRGRRFVFNAKLFRLTGRCFAEDGAKEFFRQLSRSRCALVPGSGSMNSLWWHDWLYPKVFTVLAARAMGVPVAMSSQGVGPEFAHPLDAAMAREMFSACELVGVRDGEGSARILREIGVPEAPGYHRGS